jgi:acyl carrier protein
MDKNKVNEVIAEQLGLTIDQVKPEASFVDDLDADSLDLVELIMTLEQEFKIEIPDTEAASLKTVGDVHKYIQKHSKV